MLALQSLVESSPDGIHQDRKGYPNQQPEEATAELPQGKVVYVAEDQLERAEEEIQDAKQDGREGTEAQAHWLQHQK